MEQSINILNVYTEVRKLEQIRDKAMSKVVVVNFFSLTL